MVAVQQDLNDPKKLGPDEVPAVIYQEPISGLPLHRPFVRPVIDPARSQSRLLLAGKAQAI